MMLPSVTAEEPTKIKFGLGIEIREIKDGDWYKASLPQVDITDKGKASLVVKDEIKGHPALLESVSDIVAKEEHMLKWAETDSLQTAVQRLLESVSDIVAKEEQMLKWAETDSLQTAVQRRMYIIAKYREMLLRKYLESRRNNFESGSTAIDLQVLDMHSDAHRLSLSKLLKLMREHKLEWTRPYSSKLFEGANVQCGAVISRSNPNMKSICWITKMTLISGSWTATEGPDMWIRECRTPISHKWGLLPQRIYVDNLAPICTFIEPVQDLDSRPPFCGRRGWTKFCTDVVQFSLFGRLLLVGMHKFCTDTVVVGPVVDIETDPTEFLGISRRHPDANPNFDSSSSSQSTNLNSTSSSSSSDSPMHFTADDIPLDEEITAVDIPLDVETPVAQISMSNAIFSSNDCTEEFSQLRATVDKISLEQVQSRFHVDELKAALSQKISNLETSFLTASVNQDIVVLAQTDVLRKEMQAQTDALSKELVDMPLNCLKSLRTSIGGMMPKRRKWRVAAEVHSLLTIKADLVVEVGANLQGKEVVDLIEEEENTSSRGFRYWLGGS
ncbi:hypothetical protein F511_40913 [Dorcoceras hygrometricum]|uniref:Uncharacterized protein n=1 Tax=Dorcoceras hygrometricum TaxID=472368 RepID=A0A2Z7CL45_9LAMI|nr:hypothetical protein F511_40913 [Dorcoceras hygrometricum]